jgi:hypothetical protein
VRAWHLAAALSGLVLYAGVRFGWWAPQSREALDETMGKAGRLEKLFLVALAAAVIVFGLWNGPASP